MSRRAQQQTLHRYPRRANWCNLLAELPAEYVDFRKIEGSDCAFGGQAILK
jgi:hypothetical protein